MNRSTSSPDDHDTAETEELPFSPRKIPSVTSLFHILWLRKWVALIAWLVIAVPVGSVLSIFDLPKSYYATTVMRFPEVIGAQTNVMRDVAITQGQSIISILNSFQVLDGTIRKLGMRLRITTPDLFQKDVFKDLRYTDGLGLGTYSIALEKRGSKAIVTYKPPEGGSEYKIFSGSLQSEGRLSMPGLEMAFTPEFLSGVRGNRVELAFEEFDKTYRELRKGMSARPLGGGNFEIRLKDRDPWLVADILNTLQKQFLDVYYGTTEVQDVGILVQMEKDLDLAKEKLEKSQDELSHYYAEHPELSQQAGQSQGDNLAYLDARQKIESLEQRKRRVVQAFAAKEQNAPPEKNFFWASELLVAMAEAGEAKANILRASLQELNSRQLGYRTSLGPEHPKILEVEAEKDSIYRQIEEIQAALVRRMDLDLSDLRLRMAGNAPRGNSRPAVKFQLELERLNNVNKNSQNIYDRLLESYNRAKLVTGSEFFKVSVVDPARPALYEPPSHKTRLLIAASAVLLLLLVVPGLVLAWSLVIIKIWTKDDVRRLLSLRTLGVVTERRVKRPKSGRGKIAPEEEARPSRVDPLLLIHGAWSQLEDIETFRLVREEIENSFRNPAHPGRYCLMVTSSRPHEGKSTCSANLAVTFARKGKRTLLIDADFRLGRVAKIFNLNVPTGIDTILDQPDIRGEQLMESVSLAFLPTLQQNLIVAPCKASNANASELISSDRFKDFLLLAREQFDVVIIDTPPVMITPEPLSLAEAVDGIIFVCRSGMTLASEARDAVEFLKERNLKVSALLNRVKTSPFEANRYKKYSYYYQVQPAPNAQEG
ncbi:MAG: Capsular polysaccharide synthesis enzyme CpsD, exopolysaccharide synthesis [Fibrobacteres bacterium]|nr:Capsular polysaccharide synthesis enzyme CpsD, exopolysaccharide synthesis [Fibrobacterota bacterium]